MRSAVRSRELAAGMDARDPGELDLRALGRALWRKKLWVVLPMLLAAVLALVAVNVVTPRYKSEVRLIIEGRENVFLRPEAEKAGERDRAALDQEAINSQVQLALSREVARQAIKELKLEELPEFDPALRPIGPVRNFLIVLGIARDPARLTPEERIFESYYDRVQAYQVEKSRVIAIDFQSIDPELAGRGARAVAESYLALLQVVRQNQTRVAGQWLADQIDSLRARVAEAEARVEEFRSKSNLFVGTNNNTLSSQQLGELNTQLGVARAQMADAETKARLIREMLRSGRPIEYSEILNSELIRRLSEQRVTLRAQLAEQSSTLLDGHPRIKELRAQIADLERQIRVEAERHVRILENDARIAAARVEQLSAQLDQLKRQATANNEHDVQLRALEREAKAQRDLLESYLAKYREAAARENMSAGPADARIISYPIVSNTPHFPKKVPIILIATLATLLLSLGWITTGELLAGNVYRPATASMGPMEAYATYVSPQGFASVPALIPAQQPSWAAAATSVDPEPGFKTLVRGFAREGRSRLVLVGIGPDAEVGQTAVALARSLSAYARTIVVDLAFGAPRVAALTGNVEGTGIGDLLRGAGSFGEIIGRDQASRTHVVTAGQPGTDPAAALASERLIISLDALERTYDHVVICAGTLGDMPLERIARVAPRAVIVAPPQLEADAIARVSGDLRAAGCTDVAVLTDVPRELGSASGAPAAAA